MAKDCNLLVMVLGCIHLATNKKDKNQFIDESLIMRLLTGVGPGYPGDGVGRYEPDGDGVGFGNGVVDS